MQLLVVGDKSFYSAFKVGKTLIVVMVSHSKVARVDITVLNQRCLHALKGLKEDVFG